MIVIAMTHEIGSSGEQVGCRLARRLGLDFADQQFLTDRIANRLAQDVGPILRASMQSTGLRRCLDVDDRSLARAAADEIVERAAYGNVLLQGWGAATLLGDHPNTIRIRVFAPMEFRLRALAAAGQMQDEQALRNKIRRSDACLASNLEPVLGAGWRSAEHYHLMLGAHALSVDDSVELILRTIEARRRHVSMRAVEPISTDGARKGRGRSGQCPGMNDIDHASFTKAEQLLFGSSPQSAAYSRSLPPA